ncbi:hypothetical protein PFISCL1PPCAC_12911, partial [Pristionchus fissidentatus]
ISQAQTKKFIMSQQRNMLIIVSACTISHIIKATHQFCWVFPAYFQLNSVNAIMQSTYVYTHYLATYSASVTLVIFSPRVRKLLVSRRRNEEERIATTQSYLIIRLFFSKSVYFRTPFFFFFKLTGLLGCISVVGFIIASRFQIPEEQAWIFKLGYV